MGLGEAVQNPKIIEGAVEELTRIAGQKAVVTKAQLRIAQYRYTKIKTTQGLKCRIQIMSYRCVFKKIHCVDLLRV